MKAFVRFRRLEADGRVRHIAFYRPDHHILRQVVPFFVERCRDGSWSILTPEESAHWENGQVHFAEGWIEPTAGQDPVEDLWTTYYAAAFNPARLNPKAFQADMPAHIWAGLPEGRVIPELLKQGAAHARRMLEQAGRTAESFLPPNADLQATRKSAFRCRGCSLHQEATQTVFGSGCQTASVVLVGEQPGSEEDIAGEPFVGPSGRLLDRALVRAGLSRSDLYLTNAVKHFKFEERGGRRIHQKPRYSEVIACRPWLERELELIGPRIVLCLGATALQSLLGPAARLKDVNGQFVSTRWAPHLTGTIHPAAILRAEPKRQSELFHMLVGDLTRVRELRDRLEPTALLKS